MHQPSVSGLVVQLDNKLVGVNAESEHLHVFEEIPKYLNALSEKSFEAHVNLKS